MSKPVARRAPLRALVPCLLALAMLLTPVSHTSLAAPRPSQIAPATTLRCKLEWRVGAARVAR